MFKIFQFPNAYQKTLSSGLLWPQMISQSSLVWPHSMTLSRVLSLSHVKKYTHPIDYKVLRKEKEELM